MPKKKIKPTGARVVSGLDLPHKRVSGWKWMQECAGEKEFSNARLAFYADKLLELGMSEADIQCMFSDLYWDCYTECVANHTFEKLDPPKK